MRLNTELKLNKLCLATSFEKQLEKESVVVNFRNVCERETREVGESANSLLKI